MMCLNNTANKVKLIDLPQGLYFEIYWLVLSCVYTSSKIQWTVYTDH